MRRDTDLRNQERLRLVRSYVAGQLGEACGQLSLNDVARAAQTAPHYLHRTFRSLTGESLHQYIRDLRLHLAAYQLLFTDVAIGDLARRSGYESNAAFTKAFRAVIGVTPSQFRLQEAAGSGYDVNGCDMKLPEPDVRFRPGVRIGFLRHFGRYADVPQVWGKLRDRLAAIGQQPDRATPVGIVYDGPMHCLSKRVRYDACVVVPETFVPSGGIGVQVIGDLTVASVPAPAEPATLTATHFRLAVRMALARGVSAIRPLPFYERYASWPFAAAEPAPVEVGVGLVDQG